jgi:hypothetical protein
MGALRSWTSDCGWATKSRRLLYRQGLGALGIVRVRAVPVGVVGAVCWSVDVVGVVTPVVDIVTPVVDIVTPVVDIVTPVVDIVTCVVDVIVVLVECVVAHT